MGIHQIITPLLFFLVTSSVTFGQGTPIAACDDFFRALSSDKADIGATFTKGAHISTMVYDSAGLPQMRSFTPIEFQEQIRSLQTDFKLEQQPVVLIFREYNSIASIYCSVWISLTDKQTGEFLKSKSIQSLKLVREGSIWKINHIVIQNEHPSYPIESEMFPDELTEVLKHQENAEVNPYPDFSTEYDATKVYKIDEVDEAPVYPGAEDALDQLLSSFDVVAQPIQSYTPFIITIDEDGSASLSYAHDLSGYQIARVESMVRSMMMWYPAIKYAASVKCQLILYIRE